MKQFLFATFLVVNTFYISCQQTQNVYLPSFCDASSYCDGVPCSQHGNCYVNIFKYYNQTGPDSTANCYCNTGWTTTSDSDVQCCYQRKLQSTAFLLEFAIGFGTGHFYIGNYSRGVMKLSSSILLFVTFCISAFLACYQEEDLDKQGITFKRSNRILVTLVFGSFVAYLLWQIVDSILFGINFYTDGKGHELEEW